ncbi:LuxR C-terminal-related transcriptional regulator [Streptomyces lavendulocolor]|uniref:LuxR C-terminal-related transcriptional regulator n=2 Tax=Streptomyces lavendulocolor TaxID=67316 RepID=A0ABV2WBS7_9ACTN
MCTSSDLAPHSNVTKLCARGLEVYRRALLQGPVSEEVPDCLLRLGLMRPLAETPTLMAAVPPDIAGRELTRPIEREVLTHQHTIAAIRDSIAAAETVYRSTRSATTGPVRLLQGAEVIQAALQQAAEACREELLTCQPGGGRAPENLARSLSRVLSMHRRGVKQRTIYQHTVRAHGPTLAYIERATASGAQFRTINEVFDRLIIYDRTTAFIPDPRHELRTAALAIDHPAIVHYLAKVFDHTWERAEAVSITQEYARPPLMTDETRRAVLRLMVEGYTDAAIAGRLGVSPRTVSTHIKKASDLLGGRSRAHLAYLLAQSDLLDTGPA